MLIYADWSNSIYFTSKLDFTQNYQNAIYSLDDRQNWKLSKQTMIKIHSSIEWMKKNWVIWKKSKNQPDIIIGQVEMGALALLVRFSGRRCWSGTACHIVEVLAKPGALRAKWNSLSNELGLNEIGWAAKHKPKKKMRFFRLTSTIQWSGTRCNWLQMRKLTKQMRSIEFFDIFQLKWHQMLRWTCIEGLESRQ